MTTESVRKIYQLYDEGKQIWYDVYESPGIEGRPITVEVPREVQQPNAVRAYLLSKGAATAAVEDRTKLTAAIATNAPVVRRAANTGWRDGNTNFVSHRFVAPETVEGSIIPPECRLVGASGQLTTAGATEGWGDLVRVAQHSTAMTVALAAVFAAPLLALLNRPSFALVLFGPSRIGKSFAQLVAASALGFGREEDLPSLNASQPGLLAAALGFNDHMLPINEVGTAQGPKKEIYVTLRDATYGLMNGQDKLRHPSWSGGGSGVASIFRVICLFSSEISPDAWAARNGETRDDGEMARLIGLPVLVAGHSTIFDRPPADLAGAALSAWEKEQFQRLRQELPAQRGFAFCDYIDWLIEDVEARTEQARSRVAEFEKAVGKPEMAPVARDVVAKFGGLYAGVLSGIDARVLPFDEKAAAQAIKRGCLAALSELPDPRGELRVDLAALAERLASGAVVDLDDCPPSRLRLIQDADGFHRSKGDGRTKGREYVFRAQVFVKWFATPLRARRVLEWLDDEGFLDPRGGRTHKRSLEWAEKQPLWPNGTRVRSFCLYLPNGLSDLDSGAT
ncbi:DUF927 domain-containing protein [Methylobacterium sp. R2-1]|uniref:DUF927 domain-containing protein n=1 Tax=Methylobacterium sp. R2-1 TaxID=2587064 RepID=UPI00160AF33E|nr:DUF927 domain-containing protein [Methylobacterium sp. R2-1]MBB2963516.1 hypothetical protein [Methylobacterium sp. R2-1]